MNIGDLIEVLLDLHSSMSEIEQKRNLFINNEELIGIATFEGNKADISLVVVEKKEVAIEKVIEEIKEVAPIKVPQAPVGYYFVNTFQEASKVAMPQGICALGYNENDNSVFPYYSSANINNHIKWIKFIEAF